MPMKWISVVWLAVTLSTGWFSTDCVEAQGRFTKAVSFERKVLLNADSGIVKKSVAKGIGFSLLLPGVGQLYANKGRESILKGIGFIGLEVATWALYFSYKSKGESKERQFKKYADANWDIDKYLRYLEEETSLEYGELGYRDPQYKSYRNPGIDIDKLVMAENELQGVATHHLFGSGEQQYYEMIYKYPEQFALGWSDTEQPGPVPSSPTGYDFAHLSPRMVTYRTMRNRSNNYLSNARTMTGVLIVNRVLSGMDAGWTVRRRNRLEPLRLGIRLRHEWFQDHFVALPAILLSF